MTTLGQGFPGNEVMETAIPDDVRFALSKDYLLHNFRSGESWSMTISRAILAERERCAKLCAETIMCTPYGGTKPTHGRYVPGEAVDEFHAGTGYAVLIREGVKP